MTTRLKNGLPYHEPLRLIAVIESPLEHARMAVENVLAAKTLVKNEWIRLIVIDPEKRMVYTYNSGDWDAKPLSEASGSSLDKESRVKESVEQ